LLLGRLTIFKGRNDVGGTLLVYPIWSLDELIFAKNHLGYNLSDEEIERRYDIVGGIPRHIFATVENYNYVFKAQKRAIAMMSTEQLQKRIRGDMNSVSSLHESQPESLLMMLDDSGKCVFKTLMFRLYPDIFQTCFYGSFKVFYGKP
jgi:hypothetical protein